MIRIASLPWLAAFAVVVAACNPSSPDMRRLSVSTTTTPGASAGTVTGTAGGSLTLSAAQAVLRKIELAPVGTACAASTESHAAAEMSGDMNEGDQETADDHDCAELELGPLQVNLPLDASTRVILDALVPAGTYTGVEAKLDAVTVSGVFTDAGGMSHPFTFTSTGGAKLEIELAAPVTVGPTTSNVTVMVDVASWFKDATGAVLDPANPANAETINRNIRRSFRAFGDDDRDGVDDDHGETPH